MLERTEIRDGGILLYDAEFYSRPEADSLFAWLGSQIDWRQEKSRGRPFPRLTAFVAEAGMEYRYSCVTHRGEGWPHELLAVRQKVERAAGAKFNSLLLNFYRDGRDSIGSHADDEKELGKNPVVASISLGAVRKFVLKHVQSRETLTFHLAHGSLLVMAGTCQHHWHHGVPKMTAEVGERINLTFRNLMSCQSQNDR